MGFVSFDTRRKRTALVLVCLGGGIHRLPRNFRTCLGELPISCEAAFFFLGGRGLGRGGREPAPYPQSHSAISWRGLSSPPSVPRTASELSRLPHIIKPSELMHPGKYLITGLPESCVACP